MILGTFTLQCNHPHYPSPGLFLSCRSEILYAWNPNSPFPTAPGRTPFCFLSMDFIPPGASCKLKSYNICLFVTWHYAVKDYPWCDLCQKLIPFWGWIILHCMWRPHFVDLFTCLLPPFDYFGRTYPFYSSVVWLPVPFTDRRVEGKRVWVACPHKQRSLPILNGLLPAPRSLHLSTLPLLLQKGACFLHWDEQQLFT